MTDVVTDTISATVDNVAVAADPVADVSAPETVVEPAVPAAPPRPLDAIVADVAAAQARHDAALTELKAAGSILADVVAEYRCAITWADLECKKAEEVAEKVLGEAKGLWSKFVSAVESI